MRVLLILASAIMLALAASPCWGEIPHLINYQGMLTDTGGNPLTDTLDITFRIYDQSSSGSMLWDETQNNVEILDGLLNVMLGSVEPIELPFDEDYWLEIDVGPGEILTPRVRLSSVGYAFRAKMADTASYAIEAVSAETDSDWTISGNDMYSAVSGNVGIGTSSPTAPLTIQPVIGADIEFAHGGFNADILASNQFNIGTSNPSTFSIVTDNNLRLTVNGTGNVGIGLVSPSSPLEIQDGTQWWDILKLGLGSSSNRLILSSGVNWAALSGGTTNRNDITIKHSNGYVGIGETDPWKELSVDGDIGVPYYGSYYLGIYEGLGWNNAIGSIRVGSDGPQCLQLHSGSATARMFIDTLGNVGIQTTTPSSPLEVLGSNWYDIVKIGLATHSNRLILSSGGTWASISGGTSNSNHITITHSSGNVGIGTTTPLEKLHVNGKVYIGSMASTSLGSAVRWYNGRLYAESSSEMYKTDIKPLEDNFNKILQVHPKSFIDLAGGERNIGYIAEEFDELGLNHLVIYRDGEPDALKYELVSLYLLEVVKDLNEKNEELEKRIEELESRE